MFVSLHSSAWLKFYKQWLSVDMSILLVQYELTVSDIKTQLQQLGKFLAVSDCALSNHTHMNCVINNQGRSLKRTQRPLLVSPFNMKMNETIDRYTEEILANVKKRFGVLLKF